jgi:hypothetical protein
VVPKMLTLRLSLRRPLLLVVVNAVEDFLACGLWPHGEQFGFQVETKESPLSKVLVSMPESASRPLVDFGVLNYNLIK